MTTPTIAQPPPEFRPYRPGLHWRGPGIGVGAQYWRWGHRAGRTDACRRLWKHLDDDGRREATRIALEGDD